MRHRWDPRADPPAVVRPVRVDPAGVAGPTRGAARGKGWRQTSAGFFVPAHVDAHAVEQRIVEAAMLLPSDGSGAVTGWAALRLHGGRFFDGLAQDGITEVPVPLLLPGQPRRPRDGVLFSQDRLDPSEVVTRLGIRCTAPRRAVFDAARSAPDLREAVVAIDMAAAAGIMSPTRMRTYTAARGGWMGVDQVRRALVIADEDARSPQEVRARLVWRLDSRLPRPLVNPPVFDLAGNLLGYADLFDEVAGLAVEYDGDDHRAARRHSDDVDREAAFRECHIEVTRVTGRDVRERQRAASRFLEARARARFLAPDQRAWTLEQPDWFTPEPPLDHLLDVRGEPD